MEVELTPSDNSFNVRGQEGVGRGGVDDREGRGAAHMERGTGEGTGHFRRRYGIG